MLLGIFAFLLVAYLRLARSDRGARGRTKRWVVALAIGPFLGWMTAGASARWWSAPRCPSRAGPWQGYTAFAVTVLWALVAIVVALPVFLVLSRGRARPRARDSAPTDRLIGRTGSG